MHALIQCSHARRFWDEAQSRFDFRLPALHPLTWDKDIMCGPRFSPSDRAKIITVMWSIWHSRNRKVHDEEPLDPSSSIIRVKEDLALLDIPSACAAILPGHGWRPPDPDFVKINTDAAVNSECGKAGAGGVARSDTSLLGAWCKPHDGVSDPLIAEAEALRDGVIFAKLRGFSRVIMETDCLEVVNLWNSRRNSRAVVAPILLDIGELAFSFHSFSIQHVNRSSNLPAHLSAKRACSLMVTESWVESEPPFLVASLLADCPRNAFI